MEMSKSILSRPTSTHDTRFKSLMDEISYDLDYKIERFMKRHEFDDGFKF